MVKFLSQIIGAKVLLYQERAIVGEVLRVLIDPDDGAFVGLVVAPVHQKDVSYIPTNEIKGFGQGFLMVEGLGSLSEQSDVIKIKHVLDNEPMIIGAKVIDENGQRIGKVEDATIDLKLSVIKKIYVNPLMPFGILGGQRIIDHKQIVKIEQKIITVKSTETKEKGRMALPAKLPVAE
jgi:sporulation protein YlmC with PRC-barrel domain